MHGFETKQRHNPGGHLRLRGWYDRKRKVRVDAEIRAILGAHKAAGKTDVPENHAVLPPVWGHKTEALVGDTIYLGHTNNIRSFILSGLNTADPDEGRVAITSPIGQALLGRHQGDKVRFRTLDGDLDYTVLKII